MGTGHAGEMTQIFLGENRVLKEASPPQKRKNILHISATRPVYFRRVVELCYYDSMSFWTRRKCARLVKNNIEI